MSQDKKVWLGGRWTRWVAPVSLPTFATAERRPREGHRSGSFGAKRFWPPANFGGSGFL